MEVETSSPLPAMQSPAFHRSSWTCGSEFSKPSPQGGIGASLFGPKLTGGINFSGNDYFAMDPRMASSPTSSLAADLSQNFHINKTPTLPTPRRSLFTSLQFGNNRPLVTTPPIPTSSPGQDSMDISPLPHKAPFAAVRSPLSPTVCNTTADVSLCSSPPTTGSPQPSRVDPPRRPNLAERKKAIAARPSLLRHGNRFTTTSSAVSLKPQSSAGISFGRSSVAPQINLEELFGGASPKQDKTRVPNSAFLEPPKSFSLESGADGSPAPLGRSVRPGTQRPKGKVRRTLSMFEHPEDVMQTERDETAPDPSPRADPGENSYLPCFNVKDDPLRRIDRATLCKVMDGQYVEHYDEYTIVDCRFEYEYQGGHISGAVNVNSIDILEEKFFSEPAENRQLIIFHCEYSAHRAPRMALHLRKRDRQLNMHRYPALHYPDIYILQGGYSSFFNQHRMRCEPQHYVEMGDEKHKRTCEREMSRFRRNTKFNRTQSYTYGAQFEGLDASPSAGIVSRRPNQNSGCGRDSTEPTGCPQRQRRMASY